MKNTTTTTAQNDFEPSTYASTLLDVKIEIKDLKAREIAMLNSLSTVYLSELYTLIKDITVIKDSYKIIREYKANLMTAVNDDNKLLNMTLATLNKALKNANVTTINLLKLSDYIVVSKFSKLSNNNQKLINDTKDLNLVAFTAKVNELLSAQNKENQLLNAKKLVAKS